MTREMIIYQYCDEGALCILRDLEIRLKPPNEFNDPFEISPRAMDVSSVTPEHVAELIRDYPEEWYVRQGQFLGLGDKQACFRAFEANPLGVAKQCMESKEANVEQERIDFLKRTSDHWAIGCFSTRCDSILMWSHYARIRKDQRTQKPLDAHSGFVIGFDTGVAPFSLPKAAPLIRVKYRRKRPAYKHAHSIDEFQKHLFKVVGTKHISWRYEREIRMMIPLLPSSQLRENRFLPLYYPQAVASVVFGCRCPIEYRLQAGQLLKQRHLRHLSIYAAMDHSTKYKLDICELEKL
jgi:hypothetical protein